MTNWLLNAGEVLLRDWWIALGALICGLLTGFIPFLRDTWQTRRRKVPVTAQKPPHVTVEDARNWAALTEADREWFQANLWDGKKVLDELPELPEPSKPLPVVRSGPALFCAHAYTMQSNSYITEPTETCVICGEIVE